MCIRDRITRIKQAYRACEAIAKSSAATLEKATSIADSPSGLDEPIDAVRRANLVNNFFKIHAFKFSASDAPSDTVLNRADREAQKETLTAWDIRSVRTLLQQQMSSKHKTIIGDIELTLRGQGDKELTMISSTTALRRALRVLLHAWSLAGTPVSYTHLTLPTIYSV